MKKEAFVIGNWFDGYRLIVNSTPVTKDYLTLNNQSFAKYRAAQNIANAINDAIKVKKS